MPDWFTVAKFSMGSVRSTFGDPDLRSPSGFDSGLSPFAQDDTKGVIVVQSLDFRRICWIFGVILKLEFTLGFQRYFFSFKANKKAFSCGRRGTTVVVDEESSG